jgi:hypothetical protein
MQLIHAFAVVQVLHGDLHSGTHLIVYTPYTNDIYANYYIGLFAYANLCVFQNNLIFRREEFVTLVSKLFINENFSSAQNIEFISQEANYVLTNAGGSR